MRFISARVQQLSPMMMDKIDVSALRKPPGGTTKGDEGDPREIAEKKIYRDEAGNPTVPTANLLRCLIDAGKWYKLGRKQVTTKDSSIVTACVGIDPVPFLPLTFREPWEVDTRPIRMLSGIRLSDRPMFHDWALEFTLTLEDDLMSLRLLRELVDAAGRRIGIGPFRPDRKGPFGKFMVTKWDVHAEEGTPEEPKISEAPDEPKAETAGTKKKKAS